MIKRIKSLYLLLVILPVFAWGETQVSDIEFASLPGEQFEIKLLFTDERHGQRPMKSVIRLA